MAIKTVAVVGAAGSLGAHIVSALLAANFTVTAITRPTSTSTFPQGVPVRRADPSSFEELKAALAGQDAVVSASGAPAVIGAGQDPLIDAAAAAGVRRFIPSEYGHGAHRFSEDEPLKEIIGRKIRTLEYVKEKAQRNEGFSWTAVATSMWFDWVSDFYYIVLWVTDTDLW
jgi:putative NADH-flavin reductase